MENSAYILVVDDEPIISWTMGMILRAEGFNARTFTDPHEALNFAKEEAPELLISDVAMPRMSGVDLAISVKQACPRCKVLLLSGHASTLDLLEEAWRMGHNFDLLQKPLQPSALLAAVRERCAPNMRSATAPAKSGSLHTLNEKKGEAITDASHLPKSDPLDSLGPPTRNRTAETQKRLGRSARHPLNSRQDDTP